MFDSDWYISNTGLCAWSFQSTSNHRKYRDPFVERLKFLLDNIGLYFPTDSGVSDELAERIARNPITVTDEEWKLAGGFLDIDIACLVILQNEIDFGCNRAPIMNDKESKLFWTPKAIEALECVYSRFFLLDGRPRHAKDNFTVRGEVPSFLRRQAA